MKYTLVTLLGLLWGVSLYCGNIAVGKTRGVFLDKEGKVWSFSRRENQLTLEKSLRDVVISKVNSFQGEPINSQESTEGEIFFIGVKGDVWCSWGNTFNLLFVADDDDKKVPFSLQIPFPRDDIRIREVVSNSIVVFFLSEEGEVWFIGNPRESKLDLGYEGIAKTPQQVKFSRGNVRIKRVILGNSEVNFVRFAQVYGYYYCFFLSEEGDVWVIGENHLGQLGLGHKEAVKENPQLVTFPEDIEIKHITTTIYHGIFFQSECGRWWNIESFRGVNLDKEGFVNTPKEVVLDEGIQQIRPWGNFLYCLTGSEKVFSKYNSFESFQTRSIPNTPTQLSFAKFQRDQSDQMCSHVEFFLTDDGHELRAFKKNAKKFITPFSWPWDCPITQMTSTGDGMLFLDESGDVYFMGETYWVLEILRQGSNLPVTAPTKLPLGFQVMQPENKNAKRIKSAQSAP